MKIVYTYEGHDPAFEDAVLGKVGTYAPVRQVASEERSPGVRAVTLDADMPHPSHDLVEQVRTYERVIDVTQGDRGPEV